jgi:hypothetical protein
LVIGRISTDLGYTLSVNPRYVADATVVFVLCLGLAFLGLPGDFDAHRRPPPSRAFLTGAGSGAVVAVTFSSLVSGAAWVSTLRPATDTRHYLAAARHAVATAPPDVEIVDSHVPDFIINPAFDIYGPFGDAHDFMSAFNPRLRSRFSDRLPPVMHSPMIFDATGHLVPAGIQGVGSLPASGDPCKYLVKYGEPLTITLPNQELGYYGDIGFVSDADDASLSVTYGSQPAFLHLPASPSGVDQAGRLFFTITSAGTQVQLNAAPGQSPGKGVCITDMEFGTFAPAANALMTRG